MPGIGIDAQDVLGEQFIPAIFAIADLQHFPGLAFGVIADDLPLSQLCQFVRYQSPVFTAFFST